MNVHGISAGIFGSPELHDFLSTQALCDTAPSAPHCHHCTRGAVPTLGISNVVPNAVGRTNATHKYSTHKHKHTNPPTHTHGHTDERTQGHTDTRIPTHTHTHTLLLLGTSRYYQFPATTTGGPPKQTTASGSHPETRRFPRRGQPTGARPPKSTMQRNPPPFRGSW